MTHNIKDPKVLICEIISVRITKHLLYLNMVEFQVYFVIKS